MMPNRCWEIYQTDRDRRPVAVRAVQYRIKIVKVIWMNLRRSANRDGIERHSRASSWKNWRRHLVGHTIRTCLLGKRNFDILV